jgi:hypothetical protein
VNIFGSVFGGIDDVLEAIDQRVGTFGLGQSSTI